VAPGAEIVPVESTVVGLSVAGLSEIAPLELLIVLDINPPIRAYVTRHPPGHGSSQKCVQKLPLGRRAPKADQPGASARPTESAIEAPLATKPRRNAVTSDAV